MLTIVVPTYNRRSDIERCLRALRAQTLAQELFEVIVVDDGSTDGTAETLARWAAEWPALSYHSQPNAGPAAARNYGVVHGRGTLIAFTDDDCVPPPYWATVIYDRFSKGLHGCLHGTVTSSLPSSPFVHSVIADGAVITSNLAVERAVFDTIGLFDTKFRAPWCEDADLYYRMKKAAIPVTFDTALTVDHPPRYQRFTRSFKKFRFFQYYGLIARKHPEIEGIWSHSDRIFRALKKLVILFGTGMLVHYIFNIPLIFGFVLSPIPYCAVDGLRLTKLKSQLAANGIRIRWQDQALYIVFNWLSSLLEGFYTFKGAIVYTWLGNDIP